MTDIASEREAAIELVGQEHERLIRLSPEHDLLKYRKLSEKGRHEIPQEFVEDFYQRFSSTNKKYIASILVNYFIALRDAADKIEGINRSTKKEISRVVEETPMENSEIPF